MRLLLVEDDARVTVDLGAGLARVPDVTIVRECPTVRSVTEAMQDGVEFEVALVDLGLPDGPGAEAISCIRRARPSAVVLAYTVFDDAPTVFAAVRAGARGYLLKSTPLARLPALLQEARAGGAPMTPAISRLVLDSLHREPNVGGRLSPRETEVLVLLSRGITYPGIARAMGWGTGTVQSYIKRIYEKLEVSSKAEASVIAAKWGLL